MQCRGCRAVQGGAGQGVHMPKPKFSIKTGFGRFWEGGGAVAEAKTEADPPPPCTVQLMLFC